MDSTNTKYMIYHLVREQSMNDGIISNSLYSLRFLPNVHGLATLLTIGIARGGATPSVHGWPAP